MRVRGSHFGDAFGAQALGLPSATPTHPGNGNGQNAAQLDPNTRAGNLDAGVPYQLVPCLPPFVRLANDPNIVYFPLYATGVFGGAAVAASSGQIQWYFPLPTIVIGWTGCGPNLSGDGLPVGRTALQTFKVQFSRVGSTQSLITAGTGVGTSSPIINAIAENILGTGQNPGLIPGNGLFFDAGSAMNCSVQTLILGVEASITLWCLQEYGPAR